MITINITNGPSYKVQWQPNMNGQMALESAYNSPTNNHNFTFLLQYYGSTLGYMAIMINGTYDSFISTDQPYFFWDFIINGVPSTKGIDNTSINDNDEITFTFKQYIPEQHSGTLLNAKYLEKGFTPITNRWRVF